MAAPELERSIIIIIIMFQDWRDLEGSDSFLGEVGLWVWKRFTCHLECMRSITAFS